MRFRWLSRTVALAAVAGLVAAACGGGGTTKNQNQQSAAPTRGGKAVFGAEQWPQCTNMITVCSTSTWANIVSMQPVLPKAMWVDLRGNYIASPLLTQAPTTANGGITTNPFTVTYHLNPNAVWDDGSPITSADFDFTWKAVMNTTGAATTAGYDKIESIDTTDPKTVVIKFKDVYADWYDIFGGVQVNGYVIKKDAFPDANADKPNLKDEMNDMISFSGGPWKMQSWSKQQEVLVRNDNYWGNKPFLDQVTFVPREEQPTEIQSLLSGEVSVIYPQPGNVSLLKQFATNPNVKSTSAPGTYYEALWLNLDKPPLNDVKVRQALAYAIDRQSVVDSIVKINNPSATVNNCGGVYHPNIGPWCKADTYAKYTYNPQQAKTILQSDGYTCPASGPCTKNGQPLKIQYVSVAGNTRRETTEALLKEKATAAGFELDIKNYEATQLFSNIAPHGDFMMAEYASGVTPDPTICATFCSDQIPTAKTGWGGGNWDHWRNPEVDKVARQIDLELDQNKRLQLVQQVQALQTDEVPIIPLYLLPNVTAWRTDKIAGPVGQDNPSVFGAFWNMDQWYLPKGA